MPSRALCFLSLLLLTLRCVGALENLFLRLNSSEARQAVQEAVEAVLDRETVPKPPFRLSVCALVRNEEFYVQEWLLWHYLLGVQHFVLYDNDSDDDTRDFLRPFVELGIATLRPWPGEEHSKALSSALDDCLSPSAAPASDWVLLADVDEFLITPSLQLSVPALRRWDSFVLHDHLLEYERNKAGAVALHRLEFGSNGLASPPLGLAVEAFTETFVPIRPGGSVFGKLLLHVPALLQHRGAHLPPTLAEGWHAVFANQEWYRDGVTSASLEPLRLNHYVSRSHEECLAKATERRSSRAWRREAGAALCELHMKGSKTWYRIEHGQDYAAAASPIADAINAMLPRINAPPGSAADAGGVARRAE
jgi:hypothetical protein